MKTIQHLIMENNADAFETVVNAYFGDGWRIVPGTIGVSQSQFFNPTNKKDSQHGVTKKFWCVIEIEAVNGD